MGLPLALATLVFVLGILCGIEGHKLILHRREKQNEKEKPKDTL